MTVLAVLTFAMFTAGFVVFLGVLVARSPAHPVTAFLVHPYAATRWSRLWIVPLRFCRKLWFALLLSAWNFSNTSNASALAGLLFVSLIVLLALQVCTVFSGSSLTLLARQIWLQPYADVRDNVLEIAALLLLIYAYFVSVLPGGAGNLGPSVTAGEVAVVSYGAYRWLRYRLRQRLQAPTRVETQERELTQQFLSPQEQVSDSDL
jgi:hypothetical protein